MAGFWDVVALAKGALQGRAGAEQQTYDRQQMERDQMRQDAQMDLQQRQAQWQREWTKKEAERQEAWRQDDLSRAETSRRKALENLAATMSGQPGMKGADGSVTPWDKVPDSGITSSIMGLAKTMPGANVSVAPDGTISFQVGQPTELEKAQTAGVTQETAQSSSMFPFAVKTAETNLAGLVDNLMEQRQTRPYRISQAEIATSDAELANRLSRINLGRAEAVTPGEIAAQQAQNQGIAETAVPRARAEARIVGANADVAEGTVPYQISDAKAQAAMAQAKPELDARRLALEEQRAAISRYQAETSRANYQRNVANDALKTLPGGGKDYSGEVEVLRALTADIEKGRYNGEGLYTISKQAQDGIERLVKVGALTSDQVTTMLDRIAKGLGQKPTSSGGKPSIRQGPRPGGDQSPLGQTGAPQGFRP